jgi:hypothetical protein
MKAEVDNFIQQSKMQMEMMKQQEQQPQADATMMPEGEIAPQAEGQAPVNPAPEAKPAQ